MSVAATPAATTPTTDGMAALNIVTAGMAPPSITASKAPAADVAGPAATEAVTVATDRGVHLRPHLRQPSQQAATAALLATAVATDGTAARGGAWDTVTWAILAAAVALVVSCCVRARISAENINPQGVQGSGIGDGGARTRMMQNGAPCARDGNT